MDWMSIIPPMPITNPATYKIPTTLAVVLYVFIYSSLLGLLMAVFSSASFLFSSREHGCVSFRPPMERQRVGGGSWPRSRRKAGSCPAPSRGVGWPRNEGSILPSKWNVCALWHKTHQSTKNVPNFLENAVITKFAVSPQGELRRISLPRTRVNKDIEKGLGS